MSKPPKHHKPTASSKKSTTVPSTHPSSRPVIFQGRDGLGAYTSDPTAFGPDRIIYHNADFVVINDLFPKSSVHLLILPRDPSKQLLHPFDAFEDVEFLEKCKQEVEKVKEIVAKELRRRYGKYSVQETARNEAMDSDEVPDTLPPGRDWSKEVVSGIHAHPSMNHLHIHVLSVDRRSPCLKHRKHYNSFATPFLVPLSDLPLKDDETGTWRRKEGFLNWDMKCWRCGNNFGNKFARLKEHLEEEFEGWKKV